MTSELTGERPWVILLVDTRRLGAPLRVLGQLPGRAGRHAARLEINTAVRFASEADALAWQSKHIRTTNRLYHGRYRPVVDTLRPGGAP